MKQTQRHECAHFVGASLWQSCFERWQLTGIARGRNVLGVNNCRRARCWMPSRVTAELGASTSYETSEIVHNRCKLYFDQFLCATTG
jgi:hypothetical protein